jgi:acyl-CoA synthetase (AMP-forming)/AMP-acid ligase II
MWYHDGVGGALPDRRHLLADRDRRPHDHAAARRTPTGAGLVHAAAARHHGRIVDETGQSGAERAGRHAGRQAALALDDPHHLGRPGALQEDLLPRGTRRQATIWPATAHRDEDRLLHDHGPHRRRAERLRATAWARWKSSPRWWPTRWSPKPPWSAAPTTSRARRSCAFVVLKGARAVGEEAKKIAAELRDWVGKEIGPIAKPKDIRFGDNLPKTRSGKIMRRLLRAIARGEEITQDVSTLEEPGHPRAAEGVRSTDNRRSYRAGSLPGCALGLALVAALLGYASFSHAAPLEQAGQAGAGCSATAAAAGAGLRAPASW